MVFYALWKGMYILSMFFMFSVIWENVCKTAREPNQSITNILTNWNNHISPKLETQSMSSLLVTSIKIDFAN